MVSAPQIEERPTFLTVLCVLTFIGSGMVLLASLFNLLFHSNLSFLPGMKSTNQLAIGIAILSALFCLWGAIRMWTLHKMGFVLYIIGALLSIAVTVVNVYTLGPVIHESLNNSELKMGTQARSITEGVATFAIWAGVVWAIFINGLFIVLYGINRKHLVK